MQFIVKHTSWILLLGTALIALGAVCLILIHMSFSHLSVLGLIFIALGLFSNSLCLCARQRA